MSEGNQNTGEEKKPDFQSKLWWRALNFIGITITPGTKRRFLIRLRRRLLYVIAGCFASVFIALLGLAKYSESPGFCNSCHIMNPYFKAWSTSKHNMVACVECHYPPGSPRTHLWKKFQALSQVAKYITRTYSSRPFAEIEDAACLECHSTRLLEGKLVTKRGIHFDHRGHLTTTRRDRKLACTSCHGQMVVGNHMEVTWNTCYLCHFKGMKHGRELEPIGGCFSCHDLPKKDIALGAMTYNHQDYVGKKHIDCTDCHLDVIKGNGTAPKDRCFTCHNQPEKLKKYTDMPFLHENHITKHNVACFHCHTEITHKVTLPTKKQMGSDCGMCHFDKHTAQRDFYLGVGAKGVKGMPSPMYLANVDCLGCHISKTNGEGKLSEFKGETFKAPGEEGCIRCHGETYRNMTTSSINVIMSELKAVRGKVQKAEAETQKLALPQKEKDETQTQLAEVKHNLKFIEGAHAIHNIYYAAQILRKMDGTLNKIAENNKFKLPDLSNHPMLSSRFCATLCHQKAGVKVPPETVTYKGKTMPHRSHFDQMPCTDCHEFGSHKEVKMKFNDKEDCQACHEIKFDK